MKTNWLADLADRAAVVDANTVVQSESSIYWKSEIIKYVSQSYHRLDEIEFLKAVHLEIQTWEETATF